MGAVLLVLVITIISTSKPTAAKKGKTLAISVRIV
jgi:hypothetical protein